MEDRIDRLDRTDKIDRLDRIDKIDRMDRIDRIDWIDRIACYCSQLMQLHQNRLVQQMHADLNPFFLTQVIASFTRFKILEYIFVLV